MLTRLAHRLDHALAAYLPEQRLYLKSDFETRFIRLTPRVQATGILVLSIAIGWLMFASAIVVIGAVTSGARSDQLARQVALYEDRIAAIAGERDARAGEAASAQERFSAALAAVSAMQETLLASEDRRHELETAVDVIQDTLRRTIKERDAARALAETASASLQAQPGAPSEMGRAADTEATLAFLTDALTATARDRDAALATADKAKARVEEIAQEKREMAARDAVIFAKLEDALNVSVEPLNKMFRAAGLNPDDLIAAVKSGYSGEGGPLAPITMSTAGRALAPEEVRANVILAALDRLNLYRIAAYKVPLGLPLKTTFRYTSGFGYRDNPTGRGGEMHPGQDLAGAYGSPVYATADGTVVFAGWMSGYGRLIRIQHAYGLETRYAHLSQIRVEVGDRVSRGDRIGDMGNSGRSTGTHLHYEVRVGGKPVDPMSFIRAAQDVF